MLEIEKYDAAALYQLSQDCDQWKTERQKRVTASDAAKICNVSRSEDGNEILQYKFEELPDTPAMRRGREMEAQVMKNYANFEKARIPPSVCTCFKPAHRADLCHADERCTV